MHDLDRLETLVAIMDRLRDPGGCPWDREQTYESLRRYLIEECYEVAEALDRGDRDDLREELGDLLLQVVFLSRLAREEGHFTIRDVIRGISEKLIRRHPHVFGEESAETPAQVEEHWERVKRGEKGGPVESSSLLDAVQSSLPSIHKARALGDRAARAGFDWERPEDVLVQLDEEVRELRAAMSGGRAEEIRDEIGDVLFTVVMLARRVEVDAESALERTNLKFRRRFRWIEDQLRQRGLDVAGVGFDELERLWRQSKVALRRP